MCPDFLYSCDFTFNRETRELNLVPDYCLRARASYERRSSSNRIQKKTAVHSLGCMPPELLALPPNQRFSKDRIEKQYIYSIAAIIHYLKTNSMPFGDYSCTLEKIISFVLEKPYDCPKDLKGHILGVFLEQAFAKSPEKRPGFKASIKILESRMSWKRLFSFHKTA